MDPGVKYHDIFRFQSHGEGKRDERFNQLEHVVVGVIECVSNRVLTPHWPPQRTVRFSINGEDLKGIPPSRKLIVSLSDNVLKPWPTQGQDFTSISAGFCSSAGRLRCRASTTRSPFSPNVRSVQRRAPATGTKMYVIWSSAFDLDEAVVKVVKETVGQIDLALGGRIRHQFVLDLVISHHVLPDTHNLPSSKQHHPHDQVEFVWIKIGEIFSE